VRCDISFETTGDEYLGISIPFVGETAMEAEVTSAKALIVSAMGMLRQQAF
jgi:hypothetical protein